MKSRRKFPPRIPTEEFSVEFGDVNGVKLYEVLNKSDESKKEENKNKKPAK